MAEGYAMQAIQAVITAQKAYCKFLSGNDTGLTGAHQAGIYISKPSVPILFDSPGEKGKNKEKWVTIKWQNDLVTQSRFIYYGQGTRNEYRITNFGHDFPFLQPDFTGALFILIQQNSEDYQAFVLNTEDEIDQFLGAFNLSPIDTNRLIETAQIRPEAREQLLFDRYIESLSVDFPSSFSLASVARIIHNEVHNHSEYVRIKPDEKLLEWTNMEYKLFRAIEQARYGNLIKNGFASVEDFINTANIVLNRRKSRAGKSLEHHLSAIFLRNHLHFAEQAVTEGNKKPDFLFPSKDAYHDRTYPVDKLITLAAKTTCKDRWRQIITEADRLKDKPKYLCTLQLGISPAQMDEMQDANVILVVPRPHISYYPHNRQHRIWTLAKFIDYVREVEGI